MNTRLHPWNAISTPLQTPQFLWLPAAKYHGDVFFHIFIFVTQKHKKSRKPLAIFCIFAFTSFFMNRKKHTFLQKKLWLNRYPWGVIQNRHERFFKSGKNDKNVKKTRSPSMDGHENRSKTCIFSCKIIIMLAMKNHYFSPFSVYRWCYKSNRKSFIFDVKIHIFLREREYFSSSYVCRCR